MNGYFRLMAFVGLALTGSPLDIGLKPDSDGPLTEAEKEAMCAYSFSCPVKIGGDTSKCEIGNPQSLHEPSASSLDCEAVQQLLA